MELQLTGRKFEITPALKEFTTEKFQRLEKFNKISMINVVFQLEKATHIAEATLHLNGVEIHASAKSDDMYNAIDELVDKLFIQVKKQKDKMADH